MSLQCEELGSMLEPFRPGLTEQIYINISLLSEYTNDDLPACCLRTALIQHLQPRTLLPFAWPRLDSIPSTLF